MNAEELTDRVERHHRWMMLIPVEAEELYLDGADLRGADLAGVDLSHAKLIDCDLTGADLSRGWFIGTNFTASRLDGADISMARLAKSEMNRVQARGTNFAGSHFARTTFYTASLRDATFDRAYLPRVSFWGADLRGASFRDVDFERSHLCATWDDQSVVAGAQGTVFMEDGAQLASADGELTTLRWLDLFAWLHERGASGVRAAEPTVGHPDLWPQWRWPLPEVPPPDPVMPP